MFIQLQVAAISHYPVEEKMLYFSKLRSNIFLLEQIDGNSVGIAIKKYSPKADPCPLDPEHFLMKIPF